MAKVYKYTNYTLTHQDNGAVNAMMSGSGPTVFGLFDDQQKAQKAYDRMMESGLAKQVFLTRFFHVRDNNSQ